jgi:hypothetical protein
MQAELVSFGIDLFDLEGEVQGAAQNFSCEVDGLAYRGWTFWLTPFCLDRAIKPLGIAFPLYKVPPDHLNRGCDDGGGTDCQTHSMFLLMRSLRLFGARWIKSHYTQASIVVWRFDEIEQPRCLRLAPRLFWDTHWWVWTLFACTLPQVQVEAGKARSQPASAG